MRITWLVGSLMCCSLSAAYGQQTSIVVTELERFALATQMPSAAGYDIRARRFLVPAGAKIPAHEHKTRAGIVYVESGSIVEYRGKEKRVLTSGDSLVEDANTVHAYENVSTESCVLIAFDLPVVST